jgi:hypothetical protein
MPLISNFTNRNSRVDDPVYNMGFDHYENYFNNFYFMIGDVYPILNNIKYDKPKIILTLEEPNFCRKDLIHSSVLKNEDKVLTICPYTSESLLNRQFVFFPFFEKNIPQKTTKIYDVIYSGSSNKQFVSSLIDEILPYNYIFINFDNDPRANRPKVSYLEKINLYAQSKVTICHNLLWPDLVDIPHYKEFKNSKNNRAFDKLYQDNPICEMPQIKSRVFEAAFSHSIILCAYDDWNVIEHFFEPDKEFIYFRDQKDLKEKLYQIINNYEKYEFIANNAFEKAINNYTTKHFVQKFLT